LAIGLEIGRILNGIELCTVLGRAGMLVGLVKRHVHHGTALLVGLG